MNKINKLLDKKIDKKLYLDKRIFVSADFETLELNGTNYVYAIGYKYVENKKDVFKTMYIDTDTNDIKMESRQLVKKFLDIILSINKKKIIVYFHNFSGFDSYFVIDCINQFYKNNKKKLIIRNNKIYQLKLENIVFLCTYLILPYKLDDLAVKLLKLTKNNFDIMKIKKVEDIDLYYQYIDVYLKQDVNILFSIVDIIINKFIDLFNIDITSYYTISSISLAFYRKKYLGNHELYSIPNYMEDTIRCAYYGGLCNLHKTISNDILYWYDVNSLYPFIMKTCEMPLGKGKYIYYHLDNASTDITPFFGFIDCDIFVPENLKIPPLPFKDYLSKSNVIAQATGYLKGIWFSEELKNAILLGCKITKIHKIIHFEKKAIIFDKFVDDLYNKRINSTNEIDNILHKSIMNSLYGRFGLRKEKSLSEWFPDDNFLKNSEYFISIIKEYGGNSEILNYNIDDELAIKMKNSKSISDDKKKEIFKTYDKEKIKQKFYSTNVAISAAISSYSRIKLINDMYKHISDNHATIFYYDTDSIFTDKPLNIEMVDDKILGRYKLLKIIEKALFITPKVYYLFEKNKQITNKFKGVKKKDLLTYDDYYSFLKKDYIYTTNDTLIRKNINTFTIWNIISKKEYDFNSKKYIKIYDNDNIFIETKPIFIEKNHWKNDIGNKNV